MSTASDPQPRKFPRLTWSQLLAVLVAVVVFVVVAQSLVPEMKYHRRPVPQCNCLGGGETSLTLLTTGTGVFYWNNEGPFPFAELRPRLKEWMTHKHPHSVLISGDVNTRGETRLMLDEVHVARVPTVTVENRTAKP